MSMVKTGVKSVPGGALKPVGAVLLAGAALALVARPSAYQAGRRAVGEREVRAAR